MESVTDRDLYFNPGDEWKNLRIKLTSTFTTGKMKMMFPLMIECANNLKHVLDRMATNAEEFEIKDLCARYTTDVIGSCAFGIETHSLDDPNSGFRRMGKRIFEFRYAVACILSFAAMYFNFFHRCFC